MLFKRIIWHHTGDASQAPQFDKINLWHKSKNFPLSSLGFYVGYHFLIEPDGTVRQARNLDEIGAHDQGENLDSLGLGIAGNFDIGVPSENQTAAAVKILGEMMSSVGIKINRIEPHRQDDATSCPGLNIGDNWLILEYLKRHSDPSVRAFGLLAEDNKFL